MENVIHTIQVCFETKLLFRSHIYFIKCIENNLDGRAMPDTVWGFYEDGCSVRLLNPQAFIPQLHHLNATLQEFAQCMVGTNIYLTPPGTQGFSPHYDDIEAFVLQVEGKKRWRLYRPRNEAEMLPRESSGNFSKADVKEMELALEVILKPGDLLYFPRGWVCVFCCYMNPKKNAHI